MTHNEVLFWKREQRRNQSGEGASVEAWVGERRAVDGRIRGSGGDQGQGDHCG